MSVVIIALCAFLCVSAVALLLGSAIYDRFFRYRDAVDARLADTFGAYRVADEESAIFRDRHALFGGGRQVRPITTPLTEWLEQSGVKLDVARLATWTLGSASLAGGVALVALPSPLLAAGTAAIAAAGPSLFVEFRRRGRLSMLRRQLPDAFGALSRAVQSGRTIQSALRTVADEYDGPIAEEFGRCYGQQDLGMSPETAWRGLASRTNVMELRMFVVGMLVQGRTGGDLVELLDSLAEMARKRLRLNMKIKAVTGEGRMQAVVLMLLPPAAFLMILALAPDYAKTLLDRKWLLGITAASQIAGAVWISRIVRVDI